MSFNLIARTARGLEFVAADEIGAKLSPQDLRIEPRQVVFQVPKIGPELAELRTVDDIFVLVGDGPDHGHRKDALPRIVKQASRVDWPRQLDALADLRQIPKLNRKFDVVASQLGRRNYSRFDVEDAVGNALAETLKAGYVSRRDTVGPMDAVDLTVRVFITQSDTRLALRLDSTPLHRRPYKQDTSKGTLHPPVAAAIARMLAPEPEELVLDPFCGDGTIPIEMAMLCRQAKFRASDLDPSRVANTRANAKRAGAAIDVDVADAGRLKLAPGSVDILATNPPWSVSVDAAGSLNRTVNGFWDRVSDSLSDRSRLAVIMDSELGTERVLRSRGYTIAFAQQLRLAGRLVDLVVGAPPGRAAWHLPSGLAERHRQALQLGLLTEAGFQNPAQASGRR